MKLGKIGVWVGAGLDQLTSSEAASFVQRIEAMGYSALWIPEAVGRDPFSQIGFLAAQTEKLIFATGIANIYARDPMLTNSIRKTLSSLAPGRFIMGLGVSHKNLVSNQRGHGYDKPLTTMRNYLRDMEKSLFMGRLPEEEAPILLGALRDKMLKLSATAASGAHTYNVTPEHTKHAREIIGPDALLCPEQMVLAVTDPDKAREIGRQQLAVYLQLPNYQNSLKQLGFEEADFEDQASDRLVDTLVCWGETKKIAAHIKAHLDAGADHVCLQAFPPDGSSGTDEVLLKALAEELHSTGF